MKRGPKPGRRKAGYDGLDHQARAAFSEYIQDLRLQAELSQSGLSEEADVELKAVSYFEAHPAEPLSKASRREELGKICRALAEWVGIEKSEVLAEVNRLAGGIG